MTIVADTLIYLGDALTYVADALCGGRFDLYGRRKLYKLCRPTATCLIVLYIIQRLHNVMLAVTIEPGRGRSGPPVSTDSTGGRLPPASPR